MKRTVRCTACFIMEETFKCPFEIHAIYIQMLYFFPGLSYTTYWVYYILHTGPKPFIDILKKDTVLFTIIPINACKSVVRQYVFFLLFWLNFHSKYL